MLQDALTQLNEQVRCLLDRVGPEQVPQLQETLLKVHNPSVWRDFGAVGKVQCLRPARRELISHHRIRL